MVALNFQKRWASDVEEGRKLQSMRKGAQRIRVGDKIQLYTGQRTKACRKLGESFCIAAFPIRFSPYYFAFNNIKLEIDARDKLICADGFKDWESFIQFFFPYGYTEDFVGYIYLWEKPQKEKL